MRWLESGRTRRVAITSANKTVTSALPRSTPPTTGSFSAGRIFIRLLFGNSPVDTRNLTVGNLTRCFY